MSEVVPMTVAVATAGRPTALARCLDALLAARCVPAEILVVDQGDGDDVESTIVERQGRVAIVHLRDHGRGLSRSRNLAIARARTELLAMTDDDCVPGPDWVEALHASFAEAAGPDVVTGPVLALPREGSATYAVSSRTSTVRRDYRGRAIPWAAGTGANITAKRTSLQRVGGFDTRLGVGSAGAAGEDADVLYRLLRSGALVRYEPRAVVYHARRDRDARLASRPRYGRGIGASCALWLRSGDPYALVLLFRWTILRLRLLLAAARGLDPERAHEELLVLRGTVGGVAYGLRARRRDD